NFSYSTGWDTSFSDNIPAILQSHPSSIPHSVCFDAQNYTQTFLIVLQQFFEFYSTINFDSDMVCPYIGNVIKKSSIFIPVLEMGRHANICLHGQQMLNGKNNF